MTRQGQRDRDVISSAQGLDFIVLDELHTYRGRQGADVAMLVRRVRDQLCRETSPICIGTSATMSSEESDGDRAEAVAAVATKLFGAQIEADAVIDESLRRATDPALRLDTISSALSSAMDADLPALLDDDALRQHPLAVWIELRLGLRDEQKLTRQPPTSIGEAARRLSEESGRPEINLPRQNSIDADAYEPPRERARGKWRKLISCFQTASLYFWSWKRIFNASSSGIAARFPGRTAIRARRSRSSPLCDILLSQLWTGVSPGYDDARHRD